MKIITDNLFVCSAEEYDQFSKSHYDFVAIRASLITFVRTIKRLRNEGQSVSSLSPYVIVNNELILKLRDSHRLSDIDPVIIDAALNWIYSNITQRIVIIHCSKGQSRSPSIAMLYLNCIGYFENFSFEESEQIFKKIYPDYSANKGIREFLSLNWEKYRNKLFHH